MVKLTGIQAYEGVLSSFTGLNAVTNKNVLKFGHWGGLRVHVDYTKHRLSAKIQNSKNQWIDVKQVPSVLLMTTRYLFEGGDNILPPLQNNKIYTISTKLPELAEKYLIKSEKITKAMVEVPWVTKTP